MIIPKSHNQSLLQTKIHRNSKLGSQKLQLHSVALENENNLQLSTHVPIATYDNLRTVLQNQSEDENVLPFKLPQIGKRNFEVVVE